jgi:predicted site-specific integrase-resolvase
MNEDTIQKRIITPKAVMDEFDITRPTFNQWVKNGTLEKITVPGSRRVYITAQSVDKILKQNG